MYQNTRTRQKDHGIRKRRHGRPQGGGRGSACHSVFKKVLGSFQGFWKSRGFVILFEVFPLSRPWQERKIGISCFVECVREISIQGRGDGVTQMLNRPLVLFLLSVCTCQSPCQRVSLYHFTVKTFIATPTPIVKTNKSLKLAEQRQNSTNLDKIAIFTSE